MGRTLSKLAQFAVKVEAVEGTAEILVAADAAGIHSEISISPEVQQYEANASRPGLAREPNVPGNRSMKIGVTSQFRGGSAGARPKIHDDLKAMGLGRTNKIVVAALGAVTNGPFTIGMKIGNNAAEGSATKTGYVVKQLAGPTRLVIEPVTGVWANGDPVFAYGAGTPPSSTLSGATADAGWYFRPQTEELAAATPSATVEARDGGEIFRAVAARGTGSIMAQVNQPLLLKREYQGSAEYEGDGDDLAGAAFAGVPASGVTPLPCKGMTLLLDGGTPTISQVEIKLENTLSPDETIGQDHFVSSGCRGYVITDRKIGFTIDPLHDATKFNGTRKLVVGSTFAAVFEAGDSAHGNGLWIGYFPAAQVQSYGVADRNGMRTRTYECAATGSGDDEFVLYQLFA